MNHVYKLVWSAQHQVWVAVSEISSGLAGATKKVAGCAIRTGAAGFLLTYFGALSAQTRPPVAPTTLPQNGVVAQGAAL